MAPTAVLVRRILQFDVQANCDMIIRIYYGIKEIVGEKAEGQVDREKAEDES